LTPFTASIAPDMRETILARLADVEAREDVRILFAVESGSRAWGFPSPDSDYDARFVYVRRLDWYLSIADGRDVIELPIEGDLDINGWDLKKALRLLLKPNAVLLEWLSSPIRYRWDESACAGLIALSQKVGHGPSCLHHYLNLGERLWKSDIGDREQVRIKKYFYVVRPAMALRWVRFREGALPMNFQELAAGVDLPAALAGRLEDMLDRKSRTKELGLGPRIAEIDDFVTQELAWAREQANDGRAERADLRGEADALFRAIVKGLS
jgi:predicted nucleotidyltransferase